MLSATENGQSSPDAHQCSRILPQVTNLLELSSSAQLSARGLNVHDRRGNNTVSGTTDAFPLDLCDHVWHWLRLRLIGVRVKVKAVVRVRARGRANARVGFSFQIGSQKPLP